jgi:beta-glucuronidase
VSGIDPTSISYKSAGAYINSAGATMDVPKACDVTAPGVEGPRGTFFYRTTFEGTPGVKSLIQFMACSFYCRVFVDGEEVGDHRAGGYSPFWLDTAASAGATREVLVVVNNEFNKTTAPTHTGGDFYNYAGITRNVLVFDHPASDAYFHSFSTYAADAVNGKIHAKISLRGASVPSSASLTLAWNGGSPGASTSYPVAADGTITILNLTVPDFKAWAIGEPNLFTLQVGLESADKSGTVDSVQVRSGVRVVGIQKPAASSSDAARVTVNGQIQKLYGANRHTMWPDTGSGLTLAQVQADVALLKELGVNWVRGAHYPQDQRFLDMLDEAGIGMWEEALGPGTSVSDFQSPYFMQQQLIQMAEMVDTSINHPSVLYHAFFNEGPSSDPKACFAYNASGAVVRARVSVAGSPPTRLVTWASDKSFADVCLPFADVYSANNYPCWYLLEQGTASSDIHCSDPKSQTADDWQKIANWSKTNYPDKPFGISETGAGGVYEWQNSSDVRWSQLYQREIVAADATFAVTSPDVSHFTIWQFNDIKAHEGATQDCGQCAYAPHPNNLTVPWDCSYIDVTCGRPGGENHKGQVDFWRRTKSTFDGLKAVFAAAAELDE